MKSLIFFVISLILITSLDSFYVNIKKFKTYNKFDKQDNKFNSIKKSNSQTKLSFTLGLPNISILQSGLAIAAVVAFHEAGHFLAAKLQGMKIQSYNIGYGPKVLSFNDSSSIEYAVRLFPLGGYVAFPSNVEYNDAGDITRTLDDPNLLQNRPALQRLLVISAGVIANFVLAFMLCTGVAATSGLNRPLFDNGIIVSSTPDITSPGYLSGLRTNDIIIKVNDKLVKGSESTNQEFIKVIRSNPNIPISLEVNRNDEIINLIVTPKPTGMKNKGSIGIGISPRLTKMELKKSANVIEAAELGYDETVRITSMTLQSLQSFIENGYSSSGDVGGPIAVIKAGALMAENNPTALLGFMAALSINLGILNALPFPALDGGQFLFVLYELLLRKKFPREFQESITAVAFGLLLIFSLSTLVNDISNIDKPIPVFDYL